MRSSGARPTAADPDAGRIFNIQRFSTEDGPGIRTTVFFKGCPLSCPWCHNPESIDTDFQLVWHPVRCVGDGACVKACAEGALERDPGSGRIGIDRRRCKACGACVDACPAGALELFGRVVGLDELVAEVEADRVFYETSGGGVTFSGGEPLMQREFVIKALGALKSRGLHTAVDTSALAPIEAVDAVAEFADMFLVDLKIMDPELHRRGVGAPLDIILRNIRHICNDLGKRVWVRMPLIPGATDSPDNIRAAANFAGSELIGVERFDLLCFSNLAESKYRALGMEWKLDSARLYAEPEAEALAEIAREALGDRVRLSGPLAAPEGGGE